MIAGFLYTTFSCNLLANSLLFRNPPKVAFHTLDFSKPFFLLAWTKVIKGLKKRFTETHNHYCYEIYEQTDLRWQDGIEDLETYIKRHRISCGVYPIFPIIE